MKTTRVFQSGDSQAVRLPKEFRFEDSEVYVKKEGNLIMLLAKSENPWDIMRAGIAKFSGDVFKGGRKQPKMQKRKGI